MVQTRHKSQMTLIEGFTQAPQRRVWIWYTIALWLGIENLTSIIGEARSNGGVSR